VAKHRGRPALVVRHQNIRWSWGELAERVEALAAGLLALGLELGERIGIWSPNCAEWVLTQFATAKAGLILVNVNPAYRRAELEYALNKVGCKALILSPALKTSNYIEILTDLAPEIATSIPGKLAAARLPELRTVIQLGSERTPGMMNFDEIARKGVTAQREHCISSRTACNSTTPSTSSSPPGRQASPKVPRSPTTIFSTTAFSSARRCGWGPTTSSAFRCRSIIASGW
jgi:fatty-acyl-CoA synthase